MMESQLPNKYIFVIGGPGVGKGSQCSLTTQSLNALHISVGQLLRDEQKRSNSPHAELITRCFQTSIPVPAQLIAELMRAATTPTTTTTTAAGNSNSTVVLLDGFPRNLEQLEYFEKEVSPSYATISLMAGEDVLAWRLEQRGKESGRADDAKEFVKQRIKVDGANLALVLDELRRRKQPLYSIDAESDTERVQAEFKRIVDAVISGHGTDRKGRRGF